jgi:hypothetical protein
MHGGASWGAIVSKEIAAGAVLENCRALIDQIIAGFLRRSPSALYHRQQSFCFILSLPLLLSKRRDKFRAAPR